MTEGSYNLIASVNFAFLIFFGIMLFQFWRDFQFLGKNLVKKIKIFVPLTKPIVLNFTS